MKKLNPQELREISDELKAIVIRHHDVVIAEPPLRDNLAGAIDYADHKFADIATVGQSAGSE